MSKSNLLIFNGEEFDVYYSLRLANQLGENLSQSLFGDGQYFVQSRVSKANFITFLEFLKVNSKYPNINTNNYYDYLLLSKEFNNILSDYLLNPEFDKIRNESMLQAAIKKDMTNKSYSEEYISEHLDEYLELHSQQMSEIPCTALYNIFIHKKRVLNNQEKAYQFIKENIEKSDNNNDANNKKSFCILLSTLDSEKIKEESFKESVSKRSERFGFQPKYNLSFISSFNQCISELKIHLENKFEQTFNDFMQQQIQLINGIQIFFENKMNSIQLSYNTLSQQSNETKNDISILTEKVKNIENKMNIITSQNDEKQNIFQQISSYNENNLKALNDSVATIENNIKQINTKNEETQNKINEFYNDVKNVEKEVKTISKTSCENYIIIEKICSKNDQMEINVKDVSDKIDSYINNNNHISKTCDDANKSIHELSNKLNDISNSNKQIFERVCDALNISLSRSSSFRGIIRQLTEQCEGNVADKGVVNVTSSSQFGNNAPKNAVDLDNNQNYFFSNNEQNAWLKYDFKYNKVRPACYLIRSTNYGKGSNHPMSWVIEGSNSDSSNDWTVLDTRNNITSLDDCNACQLFSIQKINDFYRYLRIRQTGKNSYNIGSWYYLQIGALEYFGSIQ